VIRKVTISTNIITTIAGNHVYGFSGDNGYAANAQLNIPYGLTLDPQQQNLYIADQNNFRIRKVNLLTNIIITFAGTGSTSYNGENILASKTNINHPYSIRCDSIGNIYYNDQFNNRVRKITIATNITTTIAGNGIYGYNGDNIAATNAQISYDIFLTIDLNGNVYFSEEGSNRIRKIDFFTSFLFILLLFIY
jgi:DNA-binding beta-propeller fold protein YncE